jgi:hypothetical protein
MLPTETPTAATSLSSIIFILAVVASQAAATGLNRLRKNSVLHQGTTLVVPQMIENTSGFSP